MSPAKIFVTTSLIHALGNLDIFSQLILFCPLLLLPSIFPNISLFQQVASSMVGWHHQLNGHEFEQTMGDSGGQRSLA